MNYQSWLWKLRRFMAERNGVDAIAMVLFGLYLAAGAVNIFLRLTALRIAMLVIVVLLFARVLARASDRRREENAAFLRFFRGLGGRFRLLRERFRQRRTHRFRRCPRCHATVRIPRRRGKVTIVCPRCGTEFRRHLWL